MPKISIDFSKHVGKIKAMHGVGQPPRLGISDEHMHWLTDAHIPFSRLHDVGGPYGGNVYVDIPNIFRDFNADENDPASYDFTFTDILISQLFAAKCEPIYRLGVTIENYSRIKAYRIYPPADFNKWARICEHIVRHYNEGWADGSKYGIRYFEIWNEADNKPTTIENEMWKGTMQQYFELYETTAKHLKKCFGNSIKVGGPAASGFIGIFREPEKYGLDIPPIGTPNPREQHYVDFALKFLDFVRDTGSPLDFFSWHSYCQTKQNGIMADFIDRELTKRGLGDTETQLNEWNNTTNFENRGKSIASANAAAMMIEMQNKKTDILCYYDARIGPSVYGGLFNPMTYQPLCTYYSFKAFGELYELGIQAESNCDDSDLYVLAATDGSRRAVLISNTGEACEIITDLSNMKVMLIDEAHFLSESGYDPARFVLDKNQVALITE